ncbi:unnamed protein product [Porites evermanni]|uniref:Uncharacterized protein n=1 Tax=Porites evermanni TaxID=104178 RepID=A0ABN8SCK9_9CNID|nr:unnamed protein product [Porites evermanni]
MNFVKILWIGLSYLVAIWTICVAVPLLSHEDDDFRTIPLIRPQGVLNPKLKTEVRRLMCYNGNLTSSQSGYTIP